MQPQFTIEPLPRWTHAADWLLWPVMHIVTGTIVFGGRPQETHRWHIQPIPSEVFNALDKTGMITEKGDPTATRRHALGLPLAHLPVLGGWRNFVVIRPVEDICPWHVGWSTKEGTNIIRYPLGGKVRMLIGPERVHFFGVCAKTGDQIPLRDFGHGKLWETRHKHIRLA